MKRAFVLLAFGAALCLPPEPALAQTGAARGRVLDEKGEPIEGAKVEIEYKGGVTRKFETKTSKKGEFTQVGLQSGIYEITISKEGYQPAMTGGRISLGDPTYLPDVTLRKPGARAGGGGGAEEIQKGFKAALDLTQAGKYDEAEAAYKELLTKAPSIPEIHYNLGFLNTQKKDWAAAEAAFQKALELKPDYADAVVALAKVYQDAGQPDKGLELMAKAAEGGDAKVAFNLGILFLNSGRSEEALQAFLKSEAGDATNPEVHYYLGTLLVGQNKLPEAIARLEKYLTMSPQNPQNVATAQGLLQALKPKK